MKIRNILLFLCVLLPFVISYKAFFLGGHLISGDAPFFYSENLKELFNKPLVWDYRNDNFGAPQNYVLWLTLPTFIFGLIHQFIGISNDFLVRIIFFFPATLLAFLGGWLFASLFTKNIYAKFLASILYAFNTYFFVVLDGGQLGVALSYGLFPIAVYFLNKFFEQTTVKKFSLALITLFLISNIDLRTFFISILFFIVWRFLKFLVFTRNFNFRLVLQDFKFFIKKGLCILLPLILLNAFWLLPMLEPDNLSLTNFYANSGLSLISLLNSLVLFQPHFPLNEFGKLAPVPFYFGFIPLLLLLGLIIKVRDEDVTTRRYYVIFLFLFLLFAFLAKGANEPFGEIYSALVNKVPFGISFRDSSKFFMPLILSASLLVALSLDRLKKRIKSSRIFLSLVAVSYVYLMILIYPALLGRLSGTLSSNQVDADYTNVYKHISESPGFYRTLWFPERPNLAFAGWSKPAISANNLYKESPFASMIMGEYDLFYFLHSPDLMDWLKTLGIKYVLFPADERKKTYTDQEVENRQLFLQFVDNVFASHKLDWSTSFPVYEVPRPQGRFFTQNKMILTVGGVNVYQSLRHKLNFDIAAVGAIFLEDRLTDSNKLLALPEKSTVVLLKDQGVKADVTMSFLKDHFIDFNKLSKGDWGIYGSGDYIKWRYELLRHDIDTRDLGFGGGLVYSSINGEKFDVGLDIKEKGKYYLAFRHIESSGSGSLRVEIGSAEQTFAGQKQVEFQWDMVGPVDLKKGLQSVTFENLGGFRAINQIALIKDQDLSAAETKSSQLLGRFPNYYLNSESDTAKIKDVIGQSNISVEYTQKDPTQYQLTLGQSQPVWVIFSDHYNSHWQLSNSGLSESYPVYGMVNGFWVDNSQTHLNLNFNSQDLVDRGLVISFATFFILAGTLIFLRF